MDFSKKKKKPVKAWIVRVNSSQYKMPMLIVDLPKAYMLKRSVFWKVLLCIPDYLFIFANLASFYNVVLIFMLQFCSR